MTGEVCTRPRSSEPSACSASLRQCRWLLGLPSPVLLADLESVIWQSPLYDQEMREEEEELADSDDE